MKETLQYFSKLTIAISASYFKIFVLTLITTLITLCCGYMLLKQNILQTGTSSRGFLDFISESFTKSPVGTVLWLLAIIIVPIIILGLSNKYVIGKVINKLIKDKSDTIIYPFLDEIIAKFKEKQPEQVKELGDYSFDKIKLVQEIKSDVSQNKWTKRILTFAINRTNIDQEFLNEEHTSYFDIIKVKIVEQLDSISNPTRTPILITLCAQLMVLAFIIFTDY